MSAMTSHTPIVREQRPTFREWLDELLPLISFVPVAGPPVILLMGPLLLLVLLLIPPAAFLITLALVAAVAAGLIAALVALVASPYLLVRHVHARHQLHPRRAVPQRRFASSFASSPDGRHIAARG